MLSYVKTPCAGFMSRQFLSQPFNNEGASHFAQRGRKAGALLICALSPNLP